MAKAAWTCSPRWIATISATAWRAFPRLLITGETRSERLRRIHDQRIPMLYKPVLAGKAARGHGRSSTRRQASMIVRLVRRSPPLSTVKRGAADPMAELLGHLTAACRLAADSGFAAMFRKARHPRPERRGSRHGESYMRILIADDHRLIVEGVKLKLAELGPDTEFMVAMDVAELRRVIRRRAAAALALIDLTMPGSRGQGAPCSRRWPTCPACRCWCCPGPRIRHLDARTAGPGRAGLHPEGLLARRDAFGRAAGAVRRRLCAADDAAARRRRRRRAMPSQKPRVQPRWKNACASCSPSGRSTCCACFRWASRTR